MDSMLKMPYIDELRQSYVFTINGLASAFVKETKGTNKLDVSGVDFKTVCSDCFGAGATTILMFGNKGEEPMPLLQEHLERRFYNGLLTANVRRLKQTKKREYLKDMKNCEFVVPIKILNEPEVKVSYATAYTKDSPYIYLAFTDIREFEEWQKLAGADEYKPLKVNATGLKRIGKKHGFLVNVCSNKLALTKDMLKQIHTKDEEE